MGSDAVTTSAALRDFGHRLFVAERPAWPLAIARIVIGVAILGWAVSLSFDVDVFLTNDGLVSNDLAGPTWPWIPLDSEASVRIALAALIGAAIAIIVGWRPTIWLFVGFILLMSIQRRNPLILNSGDLILRNLTLLLAFCPTGAALSVDRMRRYGRSALFTSSLVAPWGTRLVQVQMMVVYLFAFRSKSGDEWSNGSAVSIVFRLDDLQRFGELSVLVDNVIVVAFLTWSTLIIELALGTLLWVKRLRPPLIVFGVLLHLMIDGLVLVGFFGLAMIAGLMTFLDAERIDRWMKRRARQPSNVGDIGALDDAVAALGPTT
jgi:Vitamin K-dependent gamma-carboxylase